MKPPLKNEIRKPTKTLSGVTPIAVMLKPRKCKHGTCLYCPSLSVPQSYTPKSPAVMRAIMLNYNPYKQVQARLKAYQVMNHPTDKIELIIMGGTFLDYPLKYQYGFIKSCYDALNGKTSRNLKEAKKLNERAKHRAVALCIETRPDVCGEKEIKRMLEFGCTRVELGVQALDDKIYKKIKRGHNVKSVILATERLRNSGFKIGYHIMPGLPGSSIKKDIEMFKKIFKNENFKPDQLKIYPCQVIKGAELEKYYYNRTYSPYTEQELKKMLVKFLKLTPRYCRIMRIMREIPPDYLVAGTKRIDLRKDVESFLLKKETSERKIEIKDSFLIKKLGKEDGIKDSFLIKKLGKEDEIKEIRFREIGLRSRHEKIESKNLQLKVTKYKASGGDEYFLEIVNNEDILFGLCRLRIFNKHAIIRELHVYGKAINLGEKGKQASQHKGLGKQLLEKAEEIARKNKVKKMGVISGAGVREYYKKFGYKLDKEGYMVKKL